MTGLAGPAVAMANLSSVIQAFLDWGFLAQIPNTLEILGLVVAVLGAILMSIADDYIMKPLFYPDREQGRQGRASQEVDDLEISKENRSGSYKSPREQHKLKKQFLENETKQTDTVNNGKSDKNLEKHNPQKDIAKSLQRKQDSP